MSNRYAEDGVNIKAGDNFSSIAGRICKSTYDNNQFVTVHDISRGNFRGSRPYELSPGFWQTIAPDGAGTKPLLNDALKLQHLTARDVLAMTTGDITREGGLPVLFVNILEVKQLGDPESDPERFNLFVGAIKELAVACTELDMVLYKGETAESNDCVGTDNPNAFAPFNWGGFALGICRKEKMILGDQVQPGDVVVALREDRFRCNGISSVRKAFRRHYGDGWYDAPEAQEDIRAATTPSLLYDKMLASANGWYSDGLEPLIDVQLIAHITGGGFQKFAELLRPSGFSP